LHCSIQRLIPLSMVSTEEVSYAEMRFFTAQIANCISCLTLHGST